MKKLIYLVLTVLIISCSSDDSTDCNCGEITSKDVWAHSITIRSDCSGNEEIFILDPNDWDETPSVGNDFCINNSNGW
jgi:hypothetical protein